DLSIVDGDISDTAAIAQTKIAGLTTSLADKLDANDAITPGTAAKITYDADGLVTAGDPLSDADIPDTITVSNYLPLAGGSLVGPLAMSDQPITGLAYPVDAQDAANRDYVDNVLKQTEWQRSVEAFHDFSAGLPSAPFEGQRYISAATADGWISDLIYEYSNSTWVSASAPTPGYTVWNHEDNAHYSFTAIGWKPLVMTLDHNALMGLQGGAAGELGLDMYHLGEELHTALTGLSSTSLLATNSEGIPTTTQLSSWVTGTANQITVTPTGPGGVTLSLPQPIASTDSPTFQNLNLSGSLALDGKGLSLGGHLVTGGDLMTDADVTVSGGQALTILTGPASATLTLPTGTRSLATLAGPETLTNKTIDVSLNTLSRLTTSEFDMGIVMTNRTLTGATDANLASAAAVVSYVQDELAAQSYTVDDLEDTFLTTPAPGQLLIRNATGTGWANWGVSGDATLSDTGDLAIIAIGGKTVNLGGNVNTGGILTTGGALVTDGHVTFGGAFSTTFTLTGDTTLALPPGPGTVVTDGATQTLTNKTISLYGGTNSLAGIDTTHFGMAVVATDLTQAGLTDSNLTTAAAVQTYVQDELAEQPNTLAELDDTLLTTPAPGQVVVRNIANTAWHNVEITGDASLTDTGALSVGSIGGETVNLGGNVFTGGTFVTAGDLILSGPHDTTITVTGDTTLALPPGTDTVVTETANQTLTNKTISLYGGTNSLAGIDTTHFGMAVVATDLTQAGLTDSNLTTAAAVQTYVQSELDLQPDSFAELTDTDLTTTTPGQVIVRNAANTAWQNVPMTGDAAMTDAGALSVSSIGGKTVILGGNVYTGGTLVTDGNLTISGAHSTTLSVTGETTLTLPVGPDTVVTEAATQTLTNKTISLYGGTNSLAGIDTTHFGMAVVATDLTQAALTDENLPTAPAVTSYVDSAFQGRPWKQSVRVATTESVSLTGGLASGALIDGVELNEGDRVLVKDQTEQAENGIYEVPPTGPALRTIDADMAEKLFACVVPVREGSTNANKAWMTTVSGYFQLDIDPLGFTSLSGGSYHAGAGLTLTDTTFDVNIAGAGLEIDEFNQVQVSSTLAGIGLTSAGHGQPLDVNAGNGLSVVGDVVGVELDGGTLELTANGLKVATVSTSEIADGTIINDDINPAAGITDDKLAQITSTDKVAATAIELASVESGLDNANGLEVVLDGDTLAKTSGGLRIGTLTDDDIPNDITADNYVPIQGGAVGGDLAVEGNVAVGALTTTGGAFEVFYDEFGSQVTDQSSTVQQIPKDLTTYWQSFTAGFSGLLTQVDIEGKSSGPLTLRLYDGEGTGGVELGNQTVSVWTNTYATQSTPLDAPISVVGGQTYTWKLEAGGSVLSVYEDQADGYPGGRNDQAPGHDYAFSTYAQPIIPISALYVDPTGRVGIGTMGPTEQFEVVGNAFVTGTVNGRDMSADGSNLDALVSDALTDGDFAAEGFMYRMAVTGAYTTKTEIDGVTIGATTAADGTFLNLTATGGAFTNLTATGTLTADSINGPVSLPVSGGGSIAALNFGGASDPDTGFNHGGNNTIDVRLGGATKAVFGETSLQLSGTLKIAGGSPGAGKVLTSDADGDATWEDVLRNVVFVNDGESIQDAINGIEDESGANPYLVKVGPGVFSGAITMASFVSIEGSGQGTTIITSSGNAATVTCANDSELRFLTVKNSRTDGSGDSLGIDTDGKTVSIFKVTVEAEAQAASSKLAIGIWVEGPGKPVLRSVNVIAKNGYPYALYVYGSTDVEAALRDVTATASAGTDARAVYVHASVDTGSSLDLQQVTASAESGSSGNIGLHILGTPKITIRQCTFEGATNSLLTSGTGAVFRAAGTQFDGPINLTATDKASINCYNGSFEQVTP
ncbi:MAG: hypothetical protein HN976_37785, partial [Lentisphaerae bacterium]|nr:hypothetical protein [Lentisphaerota bacterium]